MDMDQIKFVKQRPSEDPRVEKPAFDGVINQVMAEKIIVELREEIRVIRLTGMF